MTYRLRVVPKKKRRGKRRDLITKPAQRFQFSDTWMGCPLEEQQIFGNLPRQVHAGIDAIIRRGEPGEVIGLPAAISGKPNELTAEALESLHCNFIPREPFLRFLRKHGEAALRVAETLSEIYLATLHQVRYLGLSASTAEKLARFLLESPAARSQSNGHMVRALPLTHKEIAEMIGSSRETVTRVFARFKRENLVQVRGSELRIVNPAGLEQFLVG